jgi:hypothetical protein
VLTEGLSLKHPDRNNRMGSWPVVGSSNSTICGSVTRSRARAARLCIPLEISEGYLGYLDQFGLLDPGHGPGFDLHATESGSAFEWQGKLFKHCHQIEEGVVLEHVTDPVNVAVPFLPYHTVNGLV